MVTEFTPLAGLLGGVLIGLASVLLMGGIGRIAGISGIFGGLLTAMPDSDASWRAVFIAGLILGSLAVVALGGFDRDSFWFPPSLLIMAAGGLLVGVGTKLGGGCTSGHGVCGLARLSARSMTATVTFLVVAIVVVFLTRHVV
ncbi:MAG TPA: YeeE/YedE thiosulfate transporter family protein [Hyphomicrobiales bacterium]|nr:YeeE/YedE thiosulfate transporter family protein [Hyphomicrobiales bacterium]